VIGFIFDYHYLTSKHEQTLCPIHFWSLGDILDSWCMPVLVNVRIHMHEV
jgi:hypothetical protein